MAQYKVSFDLALSPISSHPARWLADVVRAPLLPGENAFDFQYEEQGEAEYNVQFFLTLDEQSLHPRKWILDTVFENLDQDEAESVFNFECTEC